MYNSCMIRRVYIEITNVCNLNCAFCKKNTRKPRFMSAEEFEHVLSAVSQITKYIYLHVQGEPLLHPDLERFMDIAQKYGCHVQLVTNALLLKDHMNLAKHPALRKISFSLQSVEYHDMEISEFMDPVIRFIETASQNTKPYCELRFWRDDQMELARTRACLGLLKERYEFTESGRIRNEKILPGVYVDYSNPFAWPDLNKADHSSKGTCLGGITQLAVLSDGTAVPCCLDAEGIIRLGNVFEQPFDEILKSERYIRLCEGFRRNQVREDLCARCSFRSRFD